MNQDQQNASQEPTQPQEQQPITAPDARPPEQLPPENTPVVVRAKKSKKGWLIAGSILLVLLAGGALYWFVLRDNNQTQLPVADKHSESASSAETIPSAQEASTLSYAFASSDTAPSDIYWRPASGGDRTKVSSLSGTERPSQFDVTGQKVAYVVDVYAAGSRPNAGIWYSADGGKSFEKVFTLTGEQQITSLKFSTDGTEVAFGFLDKPGGSNVAKAVDVQSKAVKDLFSVDKAGIFLVGYSNSKQKIIYSQGCYNCDGHITNTLYLYDIAKKSATTFIDLGDGRVFGNVFTSMAVDSQFKHIAYINASLHDQASEMMYTTKGPYSAEQKNIDTGEVERLAEFGSASDVDKFTSLGYPQSNTNQNPYFSYDTKLYRKYDKGPVVVYEAVKPILRAYYVSDSVVIASSGTYADFLLSRYDIATKTASTLLSGDANTTIFGVTTK